MHELHSLTNDEARKIIAAKGWCATLVKGHMPPRLIQHQESFEVQKGDVRAFFYFDEVAGRRAINGRADEATAYIRAQAYLGRRSQTERDQKNGFQASVCGCCCLLQCYSDRRK